MRYFAMAIALAAIALLGPAAVSEPVAAAGSCTGAGTASPPNKIRVLRVALGRIDVVDFRRYVETVVAYEWRSSSLPYQLLRAGAQASKQYGWNLTLHGKWRGGSHKGRCYDVRDTTADQRYSPAYHPTARHRQAISSIWSWRLMREGRLIRTSYRVGARVSCAADARGRLHVRSARQCARENWSAKRILKVYYGARLRQ